MYSFLCFTRHLTISFILICIVSVLGRAQTYTISGIVSSSVDSMPIPAATVMLLAAQDSTMIQGSTSDFEGQYSIQTAPGKYLIQIQYIGHKPYTRKIQLQNTDIQLEKIQLQEVSTFLDQVTIAARRATGIQKGDTSQYDAAAFKTMKDASAQKLIEKLPGVSTQGGTLQAQGENIVQILVDGKPFFGQDINAALQNLPAEVVASVQIYDKLSDKAEMSGFDDGEREKTINIITKPNRRKGQFGRMSAGYGTDDRYLLGTSINVFNEDRRITVTGLSNNVNTTGYSADPNSDGESRPQNGIINTQTIGLNYNDNWGEKIEIAGSYQYSQRQNNGLSTKVRNYILPSSDGQIYREDRENVRTNRDHRFRMRFNYEISENDKLRVRPFLTIRDDDSQSFFTGVTRDQGGLINDTENNRNGTNMESEIGTRLSYSHRFAKKGRSINTNIRVESQNNSSRSTRLATNTYYDEENRTEILNQLTTGDGASSAWETNVSYTEPVGKRGQIELEYEIDNNKNDADRLTYDIYDDPDPALTIYELDTSLSNTFSSEYIAQEVELGYQYKADKWKIQIEAKYRVAELMNDQIFPAAFETERRFKNIAPTVRIDYEFSKNSRLDIDYDSYIRTPRISQLQDVIKIANPLRLSTGNPDLNQTFTNRLRLRYRNRNPETDRSVFLYLSSSITDDYISSSSIIAEQTIPLTKDITLEKGSQLTKPVNLDGYWDFRSYLNTGMPVDFIRSNANIWTSVNYTQKPSLINDQLNYVKNTNLRIGLNISSNISDEIDFSISTRSGYNIVENTLNPSSNNNYFYQNSNVSYDWIIWQDVVYRLNLNHRYNRGLADDIDNSSLLMNMSVGTKVFKDKRGEISLKVYDLFRQNNNIRRNVTELYIEDAESTVLQRYFMLSLHYNLRHFNKGTTEKDYHNLHRDDS